MTAMQKRILWVMTALCILSNSLCLYLCWQSDRDLAERGISIEAILAKQEYVR